MSIHSGHRQRMRNRFLKHGLDNFDEHEVLEMLLYYCIPRSDTNELAHKLIDHFGSLLQVVEAPSSELETIAGIGPAAITFISMLQQTHRRLNICSAKDRDVLLTKGNCAEYLKEFFFGKCKETVYLLCLDAKGMMIDCYEICEGGVHSASLSMRKIIEVAMRCNAVTVILAHNHPGGLALPSREDVATTNQLARFLYNADIMLADHIVVSGRDYLSMAVAGYYSYSKAVGEG